MKATERIALGAIIAASLFTALIAWLLLPGAAWWVYVTVWLVSGGVIYDQGVRLAAHEKIVDRQDLSN